MNRKYTAEQISFISKNITDRPYKELADMFNSKFGTSKSVSALISWAFKNGLRNGRDAKFNTGYEPTQFKKGMTPWNKGMKGINIGGIDTQFKKGQKGWNYKPVGTERINTDGYVDVKIADPRTWKGKHKIIWEAANGPVPPGHVLIFADGNKLNVTLENLLLITRRELVVMNKRGLIAKQAELTKAGVTVADIFIKISERKKKQRGVDGSECVHGYAKRVEK